jgi:hypothetical protein
VSDQVKSKKIQFGPGDTLGSTAPLIMMGSIDGYQPRRRRHRAGAGTLLFWALLLATLGLVAWLILDGYRRGIIPAALF